MSVSKELREKSKIAAITFAESRGMTVLEKDWSCVDGKVDIIAMDDDTLVFIKVMVSTEGCEVDVAKPIVKRYSKVADVYGALTEQEFDCKRFDTVSIMPFSQGQALLRYHRNAFSHFEG